MTLKNWTTQLYFFKYPSYRTTLIEDEKIKGSNDKHIDFNNQMNEKRKLVMSSASETQQIFFSVMVQKFWWFKLMTEIIFFDDIVVWT